MAEIVDPADHLERPPCPRCGHRDARRVLEGPDHLHRTAFRATVAECGRCGLWYQRPRLPRSRHGELYPRDYAPHGAAPATQLHPALLRYLARERGYGHLHPPQASVLPDPPAALLRWRAGTLLLPAYVPGGRLLDIGCGGGALLRLLRGLGWSDLHGIEPDPEAAAAARDTGADVRVGAVEDLLPGYPDGHFDVVVTSMVVEHLVDPFAVMHEVARVLRPGGELLLSTVTRDSVEAALFGEYWAGFDFPRHMVFLRHEDIAELLRDFRDVEWFHQLAPIDWIRSLTWRGGRVDRRLAGLGRWGWIGPAILTAAARRATRVSLRARRPMAVPGT